MTRRIRNDGRMINIDERLDEIVDVFRKSPDVVAAYIYGSYGTPDQTPLSDVDLAVLLVPGRLPEFTNDIRLIGAITDAAGNDDVSVEVLNDLPVIMQFTILSEGRLIYVGDETNHRDFLERVFTKHGDYAPRFKQFLAEYDQALLEEYSNGRQA